MTCHRCFLPSFISFGKEVSEERLFQKSTNKKQELPMTAMLVNGSKRNEQFPQRTFHRCFLPRFVPFGHPDSEQRIFINRPIRKKLLQMVTMFINGSGQNEHYLQRTFHRCFLPSFGSFVKAVSEEKIFRNQPIRINNCL